MLLFLFGSEALPWKGILWFFFISSVARFYWLWGGNTKTWVPARRMLGKNPIKVATQLIPSSFVCQKEFTSTTRCPEYLFQVRSFKVPFLNLFAFLETFSNEKKNCFRRVRGSRFFSFSHLDEEGGRKEKKSAEIRAISREREKKNNRFLVDATCKKRGSKIRVFK